MLRFGGCPVELAGSRVEGSAGGQSRDGKSNGIGRIVVGISGGDSECERILLVDGLISDGIEDRCVIHLLDGDGDSFRVAESRRPVIFGGEGEGIGSLLRFGGCPVELSGSRVEGSAGGQSRDGEGDGIGRIVVGISGGDGECERILLVDGLISDGIEDRRVIHLLDGDGDGLRIGKSRRPVIFGGEGEGIGSLLRFGGCPVELSGSRVEGSAGGQSRDGEGDGIGRIVVGISGGDGECERILLVDGLISDGIEDRRVIHRVDGDIHGRWGRCRERVLSAILEAVRPLEVRIRRVNECTIRIERYCSISWSSVDDRCEWIRVSVEIIGQDTGCGNAKGVVFIHGVTVIARKRYVVDAGNC